MFWTPEFFYGIGAFILLAALVWGIAQSRRRNRANDPITDEAVRQSYQDPEHYGAKREQLKKEVRPS